MEPSSKALEDSGCGVKSFLADLTTISHKHQLGLTGEITVFIMEKDEFGLAYAMDNQSKLQIMSI